MAEFVVMKGKAGNLIGYKTCSALQMIKIETESGIIHALESKKDSKLHYYKNKFPTVFSGEIGKLKNFQLKLHIVSNVKPIQAKSRNKPFHLRKAIEKQLETKLQQGIIEEVLNEPTEWLSETVCTPKPGTEEIRMCTDMTAANTAILREKYEMPNVEDIIYQANEMKIFSKIDLNSAFEQIELAPESRYISRFRTRKGIYQHKRLFFGVSSAPEIFHNLIKTKVLGGLVGVQYAADDILIMSKTIEENESLCEKVLERLAEHGLTVKVEKCVFQVKEITFFGLLLSEHGISLNDQKVEALMNFKSPEDASTLHSFLGLAVYAFKWIENLATIAEPLWKLTRTFVGNGTTNIKKSWTKLRKALKTESAISS